MTLPISGVHWGLPVILGDGGGVALKGCPPNLALGDGSLELVRDARPYTPISGFPLRTSTERCGRVAGTTGTRREVMSDSPELVDGGGRVDVDSTGVGWDGVGSVEG